MSSSNNNNDFFTNLLHYNASTTTTTTTTFNDNDNNVGYLFTNKTNNITNPHHSNYNPNWKKLQPNFINEYDPPIVYIWRGMCHHCSKHLYNNKSLNARGEFCNYTCKQIYEKNINKKIKKKLKKYDVNENNIIDINRQEINEPLKKRLRSAKKNS
jgi:hypothetical protein